MFTQGSLSLSDYINKLDSYSKEFDCLTKLDDCTFEVASSFNNYSKLMKLMQFLSGLVEFYNKVKSHILLMESLPSMKTAFSLVSREESIKHGSNLLSSNNKTLSSPFVSKSVDEKKPKSKGQVS